MSGVYHPNMVRNTAKFDGLAKATAAKQAKEAERTSYEELKASVDKLTGTLGECGGNLDCCHTNAMEAVVDADVQTMFDKIGEYKTTIDNQKATLEGVSASATSEISRLDSEIVALDAEIAQLNQEPDEVDAGGYTDQ